MVRCNVTAKIRCSWSFLLTEIGALGRKVCISPTASQPKAILKGSPASTTVLHVWLQSSSAEATEVKCLAQETLDHSYRMVLRVFVPYLKCLLSWLSDPLISILFSLSQSIGRCIYTLSNQFVSIYQTQSAPSFNFFFVTHIQVILIDL